MFTMPESLRQCTAICERYEGYLPELDAGALFNQLLNDLVNLTYFLAISDGKMDQNEFENINISFRVMMSEEALEKTFGHDYLGDDSILKNIPKSLTMVAEAEKANKKGELCFLDDTRVLYNTFKLAGQLLINSNGARLHFQVMLLDHFLKNILEYIFHLEEQENEKREAMKKELEEERTTLDHVNEMHQENPIEDILSEIDSLVGLGGVKKEVHDMVNLLMVQQMRRKQGLKVPEISKHLVFTGNPGTGKTTIARKIAEIYRCLGILDGGQLIETDRSGLVAGYMGQTAAKVREVAQSAMGGVLFIDEAYSLVSGKEGDFGQEAIDTLLKIMEDERDKFIVIVAGYEKPMEKFLDSNPGLRSRFNKFISFADYSDSELLDIFERNCKEQDYILPKELEMNVIDQINILRNREESHFANARTIRNYFEKVISNQANRLMHEANLGKTANASALMSIDETDL